MTPPKWLVPVLFLLCFGSIWTLLGFLYGIAPMHVLNAVLLVPTMTAVSVAWLVAYRRGWTELHLALLVGFWGGVWGTLGYDLIRIPLHYLGLNPFAPIRSYGMFATGMAHSSLLSDWAGAAYHFSNGISFGWMYALLMLRRHWAWGVLWGLVLETLAFATVYGSAYGIRYDVVFLSIAYFAHIYYGLPLGWAVQNPERVRDWVGRASTWMATAAGVLVVASVLALAWERPWQGPDLDEGRVQLGPDAIYNGPISVVNGSDHPVVFEVPGHVEATELQPGAKAMLGLQPGLHQIRCPDEPWRSAFLSVEKDGFPR